MVREGSVGLNHHEYVKLHHRSGSLPGAIVWEGSRRFGRVEPPRTNVKLYHRSGSLPCAVVLAGSKRFGRVELPRTYIKLYHRSGSLLCAMVWAGSRRFDRGEPLRTYVKLHHRSGSLSCAMVQAGLRRFCRGEPPRTRTPVVSCCLWVVNCGAAGQEKTSDHNNSSLVLTVVFIQTPLECMRVHWVRVSLGRFNQTEPPRTTVMKKEAGLQRWYEWVWGGSTTSNLLETLWWRGKQAYMEGSSEFGAVRPQRILLPFY